ncbi:hypothetical protein FA15DRAFT_384936 [Coprinopsis marcescibilis]|uniref:Uncharacterized protein n=1 Tax=Coprinopsis marcescibilis TaxID=230819 RepID=A0A5C3K9Y6_COPMA|nr:hypothetical protein FA15DRAFT_384936 [Coprinopsis marcescibilis]
MNYTWRAPEGAVLVTPFGAYTESLKDRSSIEPFIKHNCARLYHLARNRGIRTAPLYIVTGCVKSASWATASYSSEYPQSIVASLQNLARTGPGSGNQFSYRWTSKPSGTDAQTGPNTFSAPLDDRNQNLFISGYRLNALAEEEADSSKDLASVAAHTEPESGHNPGGSSLRHQDQAHGSSPESTSSSHISLGAPSGKGSRYADIDPFPQRRFALPNIGECITNYISSPFAMESIRSSIEKMQHEWVSLYLSHF